LKVPHPANSFRLKLVAYFVLLALVPMGAAYWGFTTVAGVGESQRVTARQDSELRGALALYQERSDRAQRKAEGLARSRSLQLALERRDRRGIRSALAGARDIYVVAAHGLRVGDEPRLAARFPVDVVADGRRLGTVFATVPLDEQLVADLGRTALLDPRDGLVLLQQGRVFSASSPLRGKVLLSPGRAGTVRLSGVRYRGVTAPALPGLAGVRLAALTPQSLIDSATMRTRDRLLLGLLACLGLVGAAAYLVGRSIVRNLRTVAAAARAIARGRLDERVPVRGRDEFAALGEAFNEMAGQLEARLSELGAERARLHAATTRFGEALAATHDADQLLRVVVDAAVEATAARGCRLLVAGGETLETGDPDTDGERLELPLTAREQSFGTLVLVGESFDEEQRLNAVSLAAQAAIALENARLHRIVQRQAVVDGLTGVASRRACEEALQAEVARADRLELPLALMLADLDDFKRVNDVHGHAVGDEVLRVFAQVLLGEVRDSDVAGRWGGEEFLLLLPGTNDEGAARLAERIRATLAKREIPGLDGRRFRVTASFGISQHQPSGGPDELFAAADRALYRAKHEGKDRVERDGLVRDL
jgi:diguanylate cyclase (GGDEF)-like protein